MINRKRYTTGAKVFLAMYSLAFIVIVTGILSLL